MKNYSKQREEIIGIIKELYNHPTAEEIYFLTKQKDPAVSRSTVYRNLGVLVKKGYINQIAISNGPDRYDYIEGRKKHSHIICEECGRISDCFYDFDIKNLEKAIISQTGIEVSVDGIIIKGRCNSCKKEL